MKVTCPVCKRVVSARVPKGGDGSVLVPYRHGDCDGRFHEVDLAEAHLTKRETDSGYVRARRHREAKERKLLEVINSL